MAVARAAILAYAREMRAGSCFTVCLATLLSFRAAEARAESGDGAGFGPVLGITTDGSVSLGWELSGSYGGPLLRGAVGGSYHLQRSPEQPRYFHYMALEPWVYVGGTLGLAVTDAPTVKVMYGLWEGWAQDLGSPLLDGSYDFVDDDTRYHWVFTLSIGWRGMSGTQQFYITPKIWTLKGWDFFT